VGVAPKPGEVDPKAGGLPKAGDPPKAGAAPKPDLTGVDCPTPKPCEATDPADPLKSPPPAGAEDPPKAGLAPNPPPEAWPPKMELAVPAADEKDAVDDPNGFLAALSEAGVEPRPLKNPPPPDPKIPPEDDALQGVNVMITNFGDFLLLSAKKAFFLNTNVMIQI
jgi:hypothetical protein